MNRITHPYVLLIVTAAVSTALTIPIAQRRARFQEVRRRQEEVLAELITASEEDRYLRTKRGELLSNPATVAEIAKEQYGYLPEGRMAVESESAENEKERHGSLAVRIEETGWERYLGSGEYIWRLPVAAAGLCAIILGLLTLFGDKLPKTHPCKKTP